MARSEADFSSKPWDIRVTEGDSPVIPVELTDSSGSALDLTGSSANMYVADGPDSTDTVVFSVAGVLSATPGTVTFQPTTANLTQTPGKYYYSVSVTFASTEERTVLNGVFEIEKRPAQV